MKVIFIAVVLLFVGLAHADELRSAEIPDYRLMSKTLNNEIKKDHFVVKFTVTGLRNELFLTAIRWSADNTEYTTQLDDSSQLEVTLMEGEHDFMFWYSKKYKEIITRKIQFEGGYTYVYQLNFKETDREMLVKKPVIYLYPASTIDVNVNVLPHGEMTFTYPQLPAEGWQFTAHPDGTLQFGEDHFRYLFWESKQKQESIDLAQSTTVIKEDVVPFLEDVLKKVGLSSEERADMITFWAPLMQQHQMCIVQFQFNEACNKYAQLAITPEPDHIYRIYLTFQGIETEPDIITTQPWTLPHFEREGFTIIEWGGMEVIGQEY